MTSEKDNCMKLIDVLLDDWMMKIAQTRDWW
jgi:hypothetical protein